MALLVYLSVEGRNGPVPRDRLLGLFWPESDEARARNALSQALHHLRQTLGTQVIRNHGTSAVSIAAEELWCDATALVEALRSGETDLALDLYRGDFCSALFVSGAPEVEQWLDTWRQRLRAQVLAAARDAADARLQGGDRFGAARAARRALALEPEDDETVRPLIALLDRAGDTTGALLAYQEYARRLATTLEVEPSLETRQLVEAIRRRVPPPAVEPAPGPAAVAAPAPAEVVAKAASKRAAWPRRTAVVALVLVLSAVTGTVILRGRDRRNVAPPVKTVAVLPFTLRAGAPLYFLHDGMVDLLSAKLDGTAGFHVIDPRSVVAATAGQDSTRAPGAEASARIARRLGAGWYISGDVTEVAGRVQLNGELHQLDAIPSLAAAASVTGDTAALFELVDDLAGRMLANLSEGRDTTLTRLAAVTTHSLPALKAFLEGERALRTGREAQAAAAYRRAATLDTSFALAHYRLALMASWVKLPETADPAYWAAAATRHADRLSPLGRDLLEAYRAYKEIRADAEDRYHAITDAHPDNTEAWLMMGEVRFHYGPPVGRSPMEAWTPFTRVLALDPTNLHALLHLIRLAAYDGRDGALDSLSRRYLELTGGAGRSLEVRALRVFGHGGPAERAPILAEARDADDLVDMSLLLAALVYAHDFDAARDLAALFRGWGELPLQWRWAVRSLTTLGLGRGRWDRNEVADLLGPAVDPDWLLESEALVAADPVFPASPARIAALRDSVAARRNYPVLSPSIPVQPLPVGRDVQRFLLGLLDLRLGDTVSARQAARDLLATRDTLRAPTARSLGHSLRAEIARSEGDLRRALAELERFEFDFSSPSSRNLSHWGMRERFLRAELLNALGREEEALAVYDSFQGLQDVPYLAVANLRRGEIHERMGNASRAAFYYGRLLRLWREADAEYQPIVQRARAVTARRPLALHMRPRGALSTTP